MKDVLHFAIFLAAALLLFSGCKIEKRLHRPGYHVEWKKSKPSKTKDNQQPFRVERNSQSEKSNGLSKKEIAPLSLSTESNSIERKIRKSPNDHLAHRIASDFQYNQQSKPDLFFDDDCETLVMVDGRRLMVKVIEINQKEIKYKKCEYLQGPTVVVGKKDVDRIVYANGAVDIISGYSAPEGKSPRASDESEGEPVQKRLEVMALMSMLFGITGLFIAALVFGLMALIFGFISLMKFSSHPKEFGGRGMAIAGIIIGALDIIAFLLLIVGTT